MAVCRAERVSDVEKALRGSVGGIIARGAGRSYGDAALNHDGRAVLTGRLNRILAFDGASGRVVCEAGVTFADLLAVLLPRGFAAPASPGTGHVTVGGALAADVHGKDHDRVGSFGDHVLSFELVRPDGHRVEVSRESAPRLFAATVGGMGLTGIVLSVAFRLMRAPSPIVSVKTIRVKDLDDLLRLLAENRGRSHYNVGWIDGAARGRHLGRGILQLADPVPQSSAQFSPLRKTISVPQVIGPLVLNRHVMPVFNALYYRRVPARGRERLLPLGHFLYPLDVIQGWNRLYGRYGLLQFQCVLPDESSEGGLHAIFGALRDSGVAPYLSVIKSLGGVGAGYLSFPMRGVTIALDFPKGDHTVDLVRRLNRLARDHGGRVYLAKDATMSSQDLVGMYPRLDAFRRALGEVDPHGRMRSDLARRLELHGIAEARVA